MKDPLDLMRLAIVRDMWLTGFDAPHRPLFLFYRSLAFKVILFGEAGQLGY